MSLLAPARGMPALPAKGGFSRPSFIRTPGSHLGLISPRSLAYSICLDRLSLSFTASFFTSSQFHKRFNLFIIRSTASLIGTESVRLQWKSTVLAHIERIQIYVQIYILRQKGF